MANLQGLDHIGEKIFKFHQSKDILNFRLVCKSWKQILENPIYWLKKLNKLGQTKKSYHDTMILTRKAYRAGIPPTKIGYCLLIKYFKMTENNLPKTFQKSCRSLFLRLPILYIALIPKYPDLELIQFLTKSNRKFLDPIECANSMKYTRGRFETVSSEFKFINNKINLMNDAIEGNQSLEVIKILVSQLKGQDTIEILVNGFMLAIAKQDLALCKHIIEEMTDEDFEIHHDKLITLACQEQNIEIFKLFISKKNGQFGFYSPLYKILDCCHSEKFGRGKVHKCVDMTREVLQSLSNINDIDKDGETILNVILRRLNGAQCMIQIINLIAPLCDTVNYGNILKLAVLGQDLALVEEFGKKIGHKSELFTYHNDLFNPMYDAIRLGNVNILQYLISRNKMIHNSKESYSSTPLHGIVEQCNYSFDKIHRCIEMVKLVLPKIEDINLRNRHGDTLLDEVVKKCRFSTQKKKCMFEILKLIAPVCQINKNIENYPSEISEILEPYLIRRLEDKFKKVSVVTRKKSRKQ